jgi:tRNA wybutosine-synthesizing protein 1
VIDKVISERLLDDGHVVVGGHSTVHVCHWTKQSLAGRGVCFKEKFGYGFESHRCMQISPSAIFCTNSCQFCWCLLPGDEKDVTWRRYPFPIGSGFDEPEKILDGCIEERRKLLEKGFSDVENQQKLEEALSPGHVAVCLSGEPTLYPKLPQLFESIRQRGMSSHLVTNGTNPDALRALDVYPDILLVSLYAPDEKTYLKACRPHTDNAWSQLMETLELLPSLPCTTIVELTLISGLNMKSPKDYANHILLASPDFVDIKAFVPTTRALRTLSEDAQPSWSSLLDFAHELSYHTGYNKGGEAPPLAVQLVHR